MSFSLASAVSANAAKCTDDELTVFLSDGRSLSVPIVWFPRLVQATPLQRADFRLLGGGEGLHWPQLNEDISVLGLLAGRPSVEFGRDV